MPNINYAFLDESSTLGSNDPYFIVAFVVVAPAQQKTIGRIPKKIGSRYFKKAPMEMKFYNNSPRIRQKILRTISVHHTQMVIFAIKQEGRHIPDDPHNYAAAVGIGISEYLNQIHPHLNLTVDRKFTSPTDRAAFEKRLRTIISAFAPNGELTEITHGSSQHNGLLQIADFVAGAAYQKYHRNNAAYFDLMAIHLSRDTLARC